MCRVWSSGSGKPVGGNVEKSTAGCSKWVPTKNRPVTVRGDGSGTLFMMSVSTFWIVVGTVTSSVASLGSPSCEMPSCQMKTSDAWPFGTPALGHGPEPQATSTELIVVVTPTLPNRLIHTRSPPSVNPMPLSLAPSSQGSHGPGGGTMLRSNVPAPGAAPKGHVPIWIM